MTYSDVLVNGVIGQRYMEQYVLIKNESGAEIENGWPVMYAGTVGGSGRLNGDIAIADGSKPANYTLGIATQDILNNEWGYVTSYGRVRGINASGTPYGETWNDNDIIYVSADTTGGNYLTNVAPDAPNYQIAMGVVGNNGTGGNGELIVRPTWTHNIL